MNGEAVPSTAADAWSLLEQCKDPSLLTDAQKTAIRAFWPEIRRAHSSTPATPVAGSTATVPGSWSPPETATAPDGEVPPDVLRRWAEEDRSREEREREEKRQAGLDVICRDYALTDVGNANRLVRRYGGILRFCFPSNRWYVWDGKHWKGDDTGRVRTLALDTAGRIGREAETLLGEERSKLLYKHAASSQQAHALKDMLYCAQPGLAVLPADLDADPNLLNLENGTLDLSTLAFREHRMEDMLTKMAGTYYDPDASCPLWLRHCDLIFAGDADYIKSFQEMAGYSLLFGNNEQVFFILWGSGKNGKSVTLSTLRSVWGDYARNVAPETLMIRRGEGPRTDLAQLQGVRLCTSSEGEAGARLAESVIKLLTGGDAMTVRRLYESEFVFRPGCTVWLATNHAPVIRGTDLAIWRRIWKVPFTITIAESERDPRIGDRLLEEAPGILNWCLDGLRRFYANGARLIPHEKVLQATEAYRQESDILAGFFEDECILGFHEECTRLTLSSAYTAWCERSGEKALNSRSFNRSLRERGINDGPTRRGVRYWQGIRIKNESEREEGCRVQQGAPTLESPSWENKIKKFLPEQNPSAPCTPEVHSPTDSPDPSPSVIDSLTRCGVTDIPSPGTFIDIGHDEQANCLVCQKPSHRRSETPITDRKGVARYRSTRVNVLLRSGSVGPICRECMEKLRFELIARGIRK